MDSQRANVSNMISQLTGQGAQGLANLGTSALGLGLQANNQQAQQSQQQLQNSQNSLLGNAIGQGVGALTGAATGDLSSFLGGAGGGAGGSDPYQILYNSQQPSGFDTTNPSLTGGF
jgi:hypothetical protein